MRITYSASIVLLIALVACNRPSEKPAQQDAPRSRESVVTGKTEAGRTRLEFKTGDAASRTLLVDRDSTVLPDADMRAVVLVGELPDSAAIVVETYPSRPGGMSLCQAGEERFLRVIASHASSPLETYRVKVASCWQNIELADGGITWQRDSSVVHINWLSGPGENQAAEVLSVYVEPNGRASTRAPERVKR